MGAGGASVETRKNFSRAPLSFEKFAVKMTFAAPAEEVRSTVVSTKSENPFPELVKFWDPAN